MHRFNPKLMCFVVLFSFIVMFAINTHAQSTPKNVREGVIRIKFTPEKAELLEAAKGSRTLKDASLVNAFNNTRMLNYKRVFRHAGKYEAKHRKYGLHLWYEITYDKSVEVSKATGFYNSVDGAQMVEPVLKKKSMSGTLTEYPDDPDFPNQWDLDNTGQSEGTPKADIDILQAWGIETGDTSVIVAVIDRGIDYKHEDLAANMWINRDEISDNGIDDDNNGYIDDIHGYWFGNDSPEIPPQKHGTHVAGTLAASSNNGTGISGIAGGTGSGDGVRLMSLAAFGNSSSEDDFEGAFIYAADNGAVIAQNSWGYNEPNEYEQSMLDAIDYFIAEAGYDENGNPVGPMQGGVVIFSAGNSRSYEPYYPGCYDPVIAVGGTDNNDGKYVLSNRGSWVDLSAPAVDVLSTIPENNYEYFSGTSMACPHVSGVAALIVSKYKRNITPEQVRRRLEQTTDPLPGLEFLGSGRLNAFNALQDNDGMAPENITDLTVAGVTLSSLTLQWMAPSDPGNGSANQYDIRYSTNIIDDGNFNSATRVANVVKSSRAGKTETYVLDRLDPSTSYYVAIKSRDFFGNWSGISNVISSVTLDPPVFVINPASINSDLTTGETETRTVTVSNEGTGPLEFNLVFGSTEISPSSSARVLAENNAYSKREIPASGMVGDISIRAFVPESRNARESNYELYRNVTEYETDFEEFELGEINGQHGWICDNEMFTISDELPESGQQHLKAEVIKQPIEEQLPMLYSPIYDPGMEDVSSFHTKICVPDNGTSWYIIPQSPYEVLVVTYILIGPDRSIKCFDAFKEEYVSTGITLPEGYVDVKMTVDKEQQTYTLYLDDEEVITAGAYALNIQQIALLSYCEKPGTRFYMDDLKVFDGEVDRYAFITSDLQSATVEPGGSVDVNIMLDSKKLYEGTYSSEIYFISNDPSNPETSLPVTLKVTGTESPLISVRADSIAFPDVFIGDSAAVMLRITNNGTEILEINDFNFDSEGFSLDPVDSLIKIMPFKTYQQKVLFIPTNLGIINGKLTIASNDLTHPFLMIPLYANGIEPPVVDASPDSLSVVLKIGDTTSTFLHISNMGVADLKYKLKAVPITSFNQETDSDGDVYNTDFETLAPGNIAGQGRWYGKIGNFKVSNIDPYSGSQHLMGCFDESGISRVISPVFIGGDSEIVTFKMKMKVIEMGNQWELSPKSSTDSVRIGTLVINSGNSLYMVTKKRGYNIINFKLPDGYFDLTMEVNKSDTTISVFIDDEKIFQGLGYSPHAEAFVIESIIDTTAGKISIDDFRMYNYGEYMSIDSKSGIIPSGETKDIKISFNATSLGEGEYKKDLYLYHNDPAKGTIIIPTHITVMDTSTLSIGTNTIDPIIDVPFNVFPNPVKDYMNIRFMSDVQEFVRFSLIDVTGRAYELGHQYVSQGENAVSFDLIGMSLKKGFYILNMQSDFRQYSKIKIIVK